MTPARAARLIALLAAWPPAAAADPAHAPQMAPTRLAASLDAVARLRGAATDRGGCSAVLIAPDRALTAAHCARGPIRGGNRLTLTFRPGAPEPLYRIAVDDILFHPEAAWPVTPASAHADVALLLLDGAVPGELVTPIPLGDAGAEPEGLAIFGYINPGHNVLHGHEACAVIPLREGLIGSDCRVVPGLSGSPALSGGPGGWAVEGIAVATVEAPPLRALIVDVVPWPGFVAAD